MGTCSRKVRARLAAMAAVASACCALTIAATPAVAVTTDELQAQVDQAAQAYNDATAKAAELETKISESQAKIDEVSTSLPDKQRRAAVSMSAAYKMQQSTPGLVTMLLSAETFSDFLTSFQYITAITRSNDSAVQELVVMQRELSDAQQTLEEAKEEADAQKQVAQEQLNNAQTALSELNAQIAAQAAAEAAAKAAEQAATQDSAQTAETAGAGNDSAATSGSGSSDSANSGASSGSSSSGSSFSSNASNAASNPSATDGTEVETDGDWMIGLASAYSVADNTGGNATASGDILTDDSMTVAVPLSQRYLLGRTVQIRYGGKTVTATVNDVGGFAKYGRVLDLAGGVWKSFGCDSPTAWGVRAVQYRFL